MSGTKRRMEELSEMFGHGGAINDKVTRLAYKLWDYLAKHGVRSIVDLPKANDWGMVISRTAEFYDRFGMLQKWAVSSYTPEDCQPELSVVLVFEEGLVFMDLETQQILSATPLF